MRQYVTSICVFLSTLIFLIAMGVMTCSAKMTEYLVKKQESIVVTRGIDGLDKAKKSIEKDMKQKADEASVEAYDILSRLYYDGNVNITEAEANELYKKTVLKLIKDKYKMTGSEEDANYSLISSLKSVVPKLEIGEITIVDNIQPYFELDGNRITLKNIDVAFAYGVSYIRDIEFEVFYDLSDIVLYDENPELFTYAMAADKGIYVTGKTSTIIGNIYAGTHSPKEMRKAEALYNESEHFGGVNIMSTQLAIESDKIVTDGNVNMKGAFVVFGSEKKPVEIIAKDIKETDNIASKNIYALFGTHSANDASNEKAMVTEALKFFPSIEHYYDSENDVSYEGKYRKILSSTDVTVSSDVTGIIMTPGSVIIEEGVNVEGLILSGDRIYVQGNNNIVASVDVMRGIIKEELYQEVYVYKNPVTDEERALNKLHLLVKDYLGGIEYRGIK